MTDEISSKIIDALEAYYGPVKTDLSYGNIYQLAVAVILSAQTTDRQVNAVTPDLFSKYPDFRSLAAAKLPDVRRIIRKTGCYRNKSANIVKLAKAILSEHCGSVPDTYDDLVRLPGIGRKSANVILLMGHHKPAFPVDTHIFRIANRIGYAHSVKPIDAETALCRHIPEAKWGTAHILLIRHGRELCGARKPLCGRCPVFDLCESGYLLAD